MISKHLKANQLPTLAFKRVQHDEEKQLLKSMLEEHYRYTESTKAKDILNQFENVTEHVIKVIPKDYELMMQKSSYNIVIYQKITKQN